MKADKDLEELLFKKNHDLKQAIESIPYPHIDITITSYSEISDGTPNKFPIKKIYTEQNHYQPKSKRAQTQEDKQNLLHASNSIMESMTPQKMNKLIDWSRYNVTPGDGKNIFPQVAGPSIEFSNENSLNFKQPSKVSGNGDILLNKYMEMEEKLKLLQEKHKDYTSLENLRGKDLQIAQKQIQSQQEVIQAKDKLIDDLTNQVAKKKESDKKLQERMDGQVKELYQQLEQKDKLIQELSNKKSQDIITLAMNDKDRIIENLEQQVGNLTNRLKKEMEYRKQDENLLSEIKLREIKRSSVFEVNPRCTICSSSKQELNNILTECAIEDESKLLESDLAVPVLIREVVTLLLTKQREQIDIAFQQYEEQQQELTNQLEYFRKQNDQVMKENAQIQNKISSIMMQKEEQEKELFTEYDKLKSFTTDLTKENERLRKEFDQLSSRNDNEPQERNTEQQVQDNLGHFKSIQSDRSTLNQEINQMKQQFQSQVKVMQTKITEQEKQIIQMKDESFRNLSSPKNNKMQELNEDKSKLISQVQKLESMRENELKTQQQLKEKDKKNIELYNQNKQLLSIQKELEYNNQELKEELEKHKKKIAFKGQEVKSVLEQNKLLQEKNTELNTKILSLQQQLISSESEIKMSGFNIDKFNKSIEQTRAISQYLQPNINQQQISELIEGYEQYQQEFMNLKLMFTEKLKQYELLQNKITQLQDQNQQLIFQNQKLTSENTQLKEEKVSKRVTEELTTGVRCSAATGDSINIKSFIQHGDEDLTKKKFNILDLIQPELMSTEETMYILKEILIRSVRSVELVRKVYQISEIRELLSILQQVDEKYGVSNQKLTKIVSYVLADRRKVKMSNRNDKPDFFNS